MFRIRAIVVSGSALLLASCAAPQPDRESEPSPDPGAPPEIQPAADRTAIALGVAIDARDDRGAPRLVRTIVPRPAPAGLTVEAAARDHVAALAPVWLPRGRPADLASRGVQRLRGGGSVVRLQQQIGGIAIHHGELRVLIRPDGALAAISGTLQPASGGPSLHGTAITALDRALDAVYGAARDRPAITEGAERGGYRDLIVADAAAFHVRAARARPELLADRDPPRAIWSVELFAEAAVNSGDPDDDDATATTAAAAGPTARRILIGDADGQIVRDIDLTEADSFSYRVFADPSGNANPRDGALASYNPHPTGTPDNTVPPPAAYDLVTMEAFNAPHDPWLAPDAITTSGNNVDAFADLVAPAGFGPGDVRPSVGPGRVFDLRYDLAAEPLSTAVQSQAAAVNVFFVTNWLHDWYYDSGFTEATGNAQLDNRGRGGIAGDPLIAHAQANATGGSRDNANMATPDDGLSPEMNMFLWSGAASTALTTPTATPPSAIFIAGPRAFDLTATAVLAEDRNGGTHRACGRVTAAVSGKIGVFEFDGTCNSSVAIANLSRAGAIGVLGIIKIPGTTAQPLSGNVAANLPGLVLGFDDGVALEAQLPAIATLHRTTSLEHDGDFDNAIVAHEWGHYLHHRLAQCEAKQCRAMSEGWGDFVSLHMMLGPDDDRGGTFGIGLYALTAGGVAASGFGDPGYFGIRRFPYSTDRAKNALGLRHISDGAALPALPENAGPAASANSEVHNAGEVWATLLWDGYNALIDQHGYAAARRRMSDIVVAGLLVTPPDATFLEARDALLIAAGAIDPDDELLLAAAFAGRGAGTCAVAPPRDSATFAGAIESGTIAARLVTSEAVLGDDGVSCDHDGYLDPGETGTLRLTLANTGILAADSVTITATTPTPGVVIGKKLALGSVAPRSQVQIAIPVALTKSAPVAGTIDLAVTIDSDAGCNTRKLAIELHDRIGVDEQPALSAIDTAETVLSAWTPAGDGADAVWRRTTDAARNHVRFATESPLTSDTQLVSPVLQVGTTQPFVVSLKHAYNIAATQFPGVFFNGGVIELSSDGGATWKDVNQLGVDPGYPGVVSIDFLMALAGRHVFGGKNPAFPARDPLVLDFGMQFAGVPVQLRLRLATSGAFIASGWELDDIAFAGITNTPFPDFVSEPTVCTAAPPPK